MKPIIISFLLVVIFSSCRQGMDHISTFEAYYEKVRSKDEGQWAYTSDTLLVWFESKEGNPSKSFKGKQKGGPWSEWDEVMQSRSYADSLWYNQQEHAVQGYFYETNDFYELIGKGPTTTLRTYWLDENDKFSELLIYWIPEANTHSSEHLVGFYDWALAEDSAVTVKIYPNEEIVPSRENALLWKEMLRKWNVAKDSL